MCTVTWWRRPAAGEFGVFFNRDESRMRPGSEPLSIAESVDGTAFLAARDSAAGGTWLMANARGLVAGVLNHYAAAVNYEPPDGARRSRGELPLLFNGANSVGAVRAGIEETRVEEYLPFILVAWDGADESAWVWDGTALKALEPCTAPVTTSSHRTDEVCAWRRERYAAIVPAPAREALARYHDDVFHADPAFNVRMRRHDARTESVCEVHVTPAQVSFVHRREDPARLGALDMRALSVPRA